MSKKNTTVLHMRIDTILKQQTETILNDLGITTAQAINMYFKQIVMTGSIPFNIKLSTEKLKSTTEEQHKTITVDEIFREMGL